MTDPTTLFFDFVNNFDILFLYQKIIYKDHTNHINHIMRNALIDFLKITINNKYKCDNKIKVIIFRQFLHKILNFLRDISNKLEKDNVIISINKGEKLIIQKSYISILKWLRDNIKQMCSHYGF